MHSFGRDGLAAFWSVFLDVALQEPIAVVKYSRPTAYLISATQYEALIENYQRVMRAGKLSDREIALIQEAQVQTDAPFTLDDLDEDGNLAASSQQV